MGEAVKETEDPWVCPNDRELSLRAKLSSGWSFYTNRPQTIKKLSVKREEQEIIANILKKSEEVTLREEYRVGCLVDRLENIKNNAKGNGITTCLLCDEKFGKITTSPIKCNICEKAACGKCGVDTISSGNVPIWLCKLCNEQREFWKKSGGWFLRQMPRHKLPRERQRGYLDSASFVVSTPEMSRKGNLLSQPSEFYSDSDEESSPSSEDLLDDDHHHPVRRRADAMDGPIPRPRSVIRVENNGSLSRSRTPSPLPPDRHRRSWQNSLEVSDDESQHSAGSSVLHHSPRIVRKPRTDSNRSGKSDLLMQPSKNDQEIPPENNRLPVADVLNITEDVEELFQTYGNDYKLTGPLGVIEFTVNYLKEIKRLDVHIHNAKGLRAMDSSGTSDPYVKLHLLPGASKSNKTRTRTHHKTLDPLFNEVLSYHGISEEDMKTKSLRVQVLDQDKLGKNDFIGQTTVSLKQILLLNNRKMQKILEPKSETESENTTQDSGGCAGRINIAMCYESKSERLVVGIIRCSSLLAMDSNGYSDPYVKCYLLPDPSKKTKRRTKVKKRNLNPEFNETFYYKIPHNELASKTLEITVWDHDVGTSNDFIGGLHMGSNSAGSCLKQWFETLKYKNKESKYWHTLSQDIVLNEAE